MLIPFANGKVHVSQPWKPNQVHRGMDLTGIGTTQLVAIGSGVIRTAVNLDVHYDSPQLQMRDRTPEWGTYVCLQLDDGTLCYYCHMQPGSLQVRAGQRVARGAAIGQMGNSGYSKGAHLHLEIRNASGQEDSSFNTSTYTQIPNAVGDYSDEAITASGSSIQKIIFVGDSRTVGMHTAVGEDGNIWSAQVSMGYDWMKSTGVPNIENKVVANTAVCILMGINDFYRGAKIYADYINQHAVIWAKKRASTFFVSVNPVQTAQLHRNGYSSITNAQIDAFNQEIKKLLVPQVQYIDTYNAILSKFTTVDGLHYTNDTYKEIYKIITSTILQDAGTSSGINNFAGSITVDPSKFNPFVIVMNRKSTVDYKKLLDARIIGAIVEGGYRFDSQHKIPDKFTNPNIATQISNLDAQSVPYGLWMYARAKTVEEAKDEIYYFSFVLRKYPPKLGVWLQLELGKTASVNNKILERYRNDLIRLGFKSRIGIMCTRDVLKTLDWNSYQNDFYLWLIDRIKDLSQLNELLTPEFFDTDGVG